MSFTVGNATALGIGATASLYHYAAPVVTPPTGTPQETAVVASDGSLTFTTVSPDQDYVATAGGKYISFHTPPVPRPSRGQALEDEGLILADRGGISFVGDAVTVTDDPANDRSVVTVRGAPVFNVKDYGAKGDGTTDDTAAIQAALSTAAGYTLFLPAGTYLVSGELPIRSNTRVVGAGQGTIVKRSGAGPVKVFVNSDTAAFGNNTGIAIADLTVQRTSGTSADPYDNCIHMRAVDGLLIDGVRATGGGKAIHVEGCSHFRVVNCQIDGFKDNGIGITWAEGYSASAVVNPQGVVANNVVLQTAATVAGTGSSPIIVTLPRIVVANNVVTTSTSLNNGYCIELGNTADEVVISGNSVAGGGILVGDGDRVSIIGNTLVDGSVAAAAQINVVNNTGAPTRCTIADNYVYNVSTSAFPAIKVQASTTFATVRGNTVRGGAALWCYADDSEVLQNTVEGAFHEGFQLKTGARMVIRGNVARNCGTDNAGSATTKIGYIFDTLADPNIEDNTAVSGLSAPSDMKNGFYINASTNIHWRNNVSRGHTTGQVTTTNTQTWATPETQTQLASAATLVLPFYTDLFRLTGTTTVTSITASGHGGRIVTLIMGGAITVNNGGNTALAGGANFVGTLSDAITLACDGTTWFEVSRSVN